MSFVDNGKLSTKLLGKQIVEDAMIHHPPKYLPLYIKESDWRRASDFETGRSLTKRLWQCMLWSFFGFKKSNQKSSFFSEAATL
ncbi:MAG: hypothetical protein RR583_01085 [Enterococcus sp.]